MHQYQPPWGKKYEYITFRLISSRTMNCFKLTAILSYVSKLSKSNSFPAVIDPNIHFLDTQNIICFDDILFVFMFSISDLQLYDPTMNSRKDLLR